MHTSANIKVSYDIQLSISIFSPGFENATSVRRKKEESLLECRNVCTFFFVHFVAWSGSWKFMEVIYSLW